MVSLNASQQCCVYAVSHAFNAFPPQHETYHCHLWQEGQDTSAWGGNDPLDYNVVEPVLTFFPADPAIAKVKGFLKK
jgi:hypothetical protein